MVEAPSVQVLGEPADVGARPLRIVVVDDDRDTVITLMMLLRDEGHEVKGASTAEQMWRALDDFDADVVVLDIGLPDRNGYDVARQLRARFGDRRPTLLAVTAWNKGADKLLARLAGFDHHFGKPYDPLALVGILRSLRSGNTAA